MGDILTSAEDNESIPVPKLVPAQAERRSSRRGGADHEGRRISDEAGLRRVSGRSILLFVQRPSYGQVSLGPHSRGGTYHGVTESSRLPEVGNETDAVLVATPEHNHYTIATAAIRRGKHVYCQKPLWDAQNMKITNNEEADKSLFMRRLAPRNHLNWC